MTDVYYRGAKLSELNIPHGGGKSINTTKVSLSSGWVDVRAYGAVGDGVADDTFEIQAAADFAKESRSALFFPAGTYRITSAISLSAEGQKVVGQNSWHSIVTQETAGQNAFTVGPDSGGSAATFNRHTSFQNLKIDGLGIGISTGYGISGTSDGDWLELDNVVIIGFERGLSVDGWSQLHLVNSLFTNNNYGIYLSDASTVTNTINLTNSATANSGVCGVTYRQGGGCTIFGGDHVGQPLGMQIGKGSVVCQVTLIGGNFEVLTGSGSEFINVANSAIFFSMGTQFQKSTGTVDGDAVKVDGGRVVMFAPVFPDVAVGKAIVNKTNTTDIVQVFAPTGNLSTSVVSSRDPGTSFNWNEFTSRTDNSVPSASVTNRGLLLQKMSRDSGSVDDDLFWYGRVGGGVAASYQKYRLSAVVEGSGSPESSVTASIGRLYVDTTNGKLYIKMSGANTNTGWVVVGAQT